MTLLDTPRANPTDLEDLRRGCAGDPPLHGRLSPWMVRALRSPDLVAWVEEHGSPLNLNCTAPFAESVKRLRSVGNDHGVRLAPFFARKANKCLAYVDACRELGCGVDTASEAEIRQTLARGVPAEQIVCTAAVKDASLLEHCIRSGITIVLDNPDETRLIRRLAQAIGERPAVSIRVSGFAHQGRRLDSRFGFAIETLEEELSSVCLSATDAFAINGIHFHLDGYDADQRVAAVRQCLPIIDHLRSTGSRVVHLDIGGGMPVCYLESSDAWTLFWSAHKECLLSRARPLTYRGHGLGLTAHDGQLFGKPATYPFFQQPERNEWLAQVLSEIGPEVRRRDLELRCEPGRALLDGCGVTLARVVHRRRQSNGDWHIGLAMNHTQCRTGSVDMLVDPLHIAAGPDRQDAEQVDQGFLTGAYCTESEAILLRRLRFPRGVAVGDLFALPNTAGYFMHFRESRSHQFPLAKNLIVGPVGDRPAVDAIDAP
ncbi:Diaminopimelate decarboxylase [Posidoniimonas polymericola]|uniref:Diaminopimelate decarboxylase n=1 Tax=Posidoniimonas polymericola TaxID=2528002 RepID=A0A5C5XW40_9BACT|nr:Y4yA family PLP-dependent enzyme [Posidoniimonas polymericola]TWT66918.1 Diaminopimelate decarboxylase [Posidoniimonas polymericola]